MIDNKNLYRIIGKKDGIRLVTKDETATIDDIYTKGFLITEDNHILCDDLPIGTLTKDGYWESADEILEIKPSEFVKDALLGAAVGDAFGVPYEFFTREVIQYLPVDGMIGMDTNPWFKGYWTNRVPAGAWSDDTSMIVAGMESIIFKEEIDYEDIMKAYMDWWYKNGYTSIGSSFGLGQTVKKAFFNYKSGKDAINCGAKKMEDNGNGSLMRILPFSLYCIVNELDDNETYDIISKASSITHGHEISIMACYMYTIFLKEIIRTRNKNIAFTKMIYTDYSEFFSQEAIDAFKKVIDPNFNLKPEQINQSGYVVDTFESVMYSILNGEDYRDTIYKCVKLGYDTDTNACIAGSLAGIIYGSNNIPKEWLNTVKKEHYLERVAFRFNQALNKMKSLEKDEEIKKSTR